MKLGKLAEWMMTTVAETLAYLAFPSEHWRRIRTNNPLERIMREIRRGRESWEHFRMVRAPSTSLPPGCGISPVSSRLQRRRRPLVDATDSRPAAISLNSCAAVEFPRIISTGPCFLLWTGSTAWNVLVSGVVRIAASCTMAMRVW
jgi:Transposase, Mutator family